jgi:DNA-binding transcriptional regulator LsrR (DeoR family)
MSARTTRDLARKLSISPSCVPRLLAESVETGIVECVDDEWRLTEWGEERYGQALRNLAAKEWGAGA